MLRHEGKVWSRHCDGVRTMAWWPIYLLMGLGVGVFAGMLGIGGGTMLVTLMVLAFNSQGVAPDRVLHLALGTAMATIIFTSIASFHAHHKHGAVRWESCARWAWPRGRHNRGHHGRGLSSDEVSRRRLRDVRVLLRRADVHRCLARAFASTTRSRSDEFGRHDGRCDL